MEVVVGALQLGGLVPHGGLDAEARAPMELDEGRFTLCIDEAERVDAETFHHAQAARDGAVAHGPHHHVLRLGHQRDEVPEGVVRAGRLRKGAVGLHLHGVDQVGELHRVLDEEHRYVVADQVPVALLGVELDREAAHVARRVHAAGATGHGGKAREDGGLLADLRQDVGSGEVGQRIRQLEEAVRAAAARVHDALGNALVVEVHHLLAQDEVFQQRWAARRGAQRILVVGHRNALLRGQHRVAPASLLLRLAALAGGGVVGAVGLAWVGGFGGGFLDGHGWCAWWVEKGVARRHSRLRSSGRCSSSQRSLLESLPSRRCRTSRHNGHGRRAICSTTCRAARRIGRAGQSRPMERIPHPTSRPGRHP